MPTPFDDLTKQQAQERLKDALAPVDTTISDAPTVNIAYYKGDHWQRADQWAGPGPSGMERDATAALGEIKKAFVSKNAIKEAVDRHVRAVIGNEPGWSFAPARSVKGKRAQQPTRRPTANDTTTNPIGLPTAPQNGAQDVTDALGDEPTFEEQARIDETDALIEWWDGDERKRGALQVLQDAAATLLLTGKATLRVYIPKAYVNDGVLAFAPDLKTALDRILIHHPAHGTAGVALDDDSQEQIGVYTAKDTVEVCYRDGANTILGQYAKDGSYTAYPLALGGRLLVYQLECPPLITEQVRAQQRLLNVALTMLQHNTILAGFTERTLINAQLPGHYEEDATTGERRFIAEPIEFGPGVVNNLVGKKYTDDQGKTTLATPSLSYRDPSPVATFTDTRQAAYMGILEETQQLFALISGDAAASGESRIQARADFISSLGDTITQLEAAIRWLLETVLAYAAFQTNQAGRYDDLRAVAECRIDTGPISAEDRGAILAEVGAELRSKEGGMVALGIDDPDSELQKIASEKGKLQSPTDALQTQRAQLGLQLDQQAADSTQQRLRAALGADTPTSDQQGQQVVNVGG